MVRLGDVNPFVWDIITEKMELALNEFDFQADDLLIDWRISASSMKLERQLYEKYGHWNEWAEQDGEWVQVAQKSRHI